MLSRSAIFQASAASMVLTGCSAEYPFDGVKFCLASADEANELRAVLNEVSKKHGLSLRDESARVQNELALLESPLADQRVFWVVIKDDRWFPDSGPIMVNNIGAPSELEVGVSFFQSSTWLGSDEATDEIMRDFVGTLSRNWALTDFSGSRFEGEEPLC